MSSLQIISQIKLNVSRPNAEVVVYGKQYDIASRIIDVDLVSGSEVWDPPANSVMLVMCSKPDGKTCIYDVVEPYDQYSSEKTYEVGDKVIYSNYVWTCRVQISTPENWTSSHWTQGSATTSAITRTGTGKVRVVLAEQALTYPGNVLVSLCFYQNGIRSTTLSFILNVEKSPDDNTLLESSDYFNILSQLIEGLLGATTHPPQIDPNSKNWLIWDETTAQYVDSGYSSVGTTGATGPAPSITSTVREYVASTSGTTVPSSGWSTTVPTVTQGQWLWTRTTVNYNNGGQVVSYVCGYQGVDGQDGQGAPGTATPKGMSASGSVGNAMLYSRQDHKHPYQITVSNGVLQLPLYDAT